MQGGAEVCGSSESAGGGGGAGQPPGAWRVKGNRGPGAGRPLSQGSRPGPHCLAAPSAVCHGCPYSAPCGPAVTLGRTRLCCSPTARPPASRTGRAPSRPSTQHFLGDWLWLLSPSLCSKSHLGFLSPTSQSGEVTYPQATWQPEVGSAGGTEGTGESGIFLLCSAPESCDAETQEPPDSAGY